MHLYGVFSSWSSNIGDDVQTFAVEQMVGKLDGYLDRERISHQSASGILIANGWWKHRAWDFPPKPGLVTAYVGAHFALSESAIRGFKDHFVESAPVGCRDLATLELMKSVGVPCYLSNCLTLGLKRWLAQVENGPVLAVDVPKGTKLPEGCQLLSHHGPMSSHPVHMRPLTISRLEAYQAASLVVTSRLHVALPCLAFGTPLMFVVPQPDDPRLGCLKELIPFIDVSEGLPDQGIRLSVQTRDELRKAASSHLSFAVKEAEARFAKLGSRSRLARSNTTKCDTFHSPRIFGVGPAKSGTHSLAAMFGNPVRSEHESRADKLIPLILKKLTGEYDAGQLKRFLLKTTQVRLLDVDSSQLNFFVLEELLESFSGARFVLTMRDCYSWLDSFINDSLRRDVNANWLRLREARFRPDLFPLEGNDDELLANYGLYSLRGYLTYWEHHYRHVLETVPADKLLVVRTSDLTDRAMEIADFAELPRWAVKLEECHQFKNPTKHGVLAKLSREHVDAVVTECCPSMKAYFPEIASMKDVKL